MIGEDQGQTKVAYPLNKNSFSLYLNGDLNRIAKYPAKIVDAFVYIGFSK